MLMRIVDEETTQASTTPKATEHITTVRSSVVGTTPPSTVDPDDQRLPMHSAIGSTGWSFWWPLATLGFAVLALAQLLAWGIRRLRRPRYNVLAQPSVTYHRE